MKEETRLQWDPFVAMDRLDDEQIIAELNGRVADALVYQFVNEQGLPTTGLSKAGVDAVCREMAKQGEVLREMDLEVEDLGDALLFKCRVGRYAVRVNQQTGETQDVLLDTAFGVKRQPKAQWSKKAGRFVENPFAYEQGAMKAARNAKMRLIREDLKQKVIAWGLERGAVRQVEPVEPDADSQEATQRRPSAEPRRARAVAGDPSADMPEAAKVLARESGKTEAWTKAKYVSWKTQNPGQPPEAFVDFLRAELRRLGSKSA